MKKIFWLIPVLFLISILWLFNNHQLIDYKNKNLSKSNVAGILKFGVLNSKYESITIDGLNVFINLESGLYTNDYKNLEYDASLLFSLINDIDKVTFTSDTNIYEFDYQTYNNLYKNIKQIDLLLLKDRLDKMPLDKVYLGNINGMYDLFDTSQVCEFNSFTIYEDNNYKYSLKCSQINLIQVIGNNNSYGLIESIDQKLFSVDDLLNKNLNIIKTAK